MEHQGSVSVMKTAIVTCCLLFSMHHYSSAFDLKASHIQLTFAAAESLTLQCSHSPEEEFIATELVAVREMRLVKRSGTRGWQTMTQIWLNDQDTMAVDGLDAIGKVGNDVTQSFLRAIWYQTSPDILGVYRCDIVGINENNDLVLEKTRLVTIFDNNATTKDILLSSQEHLQNLHLEFNKFKSDTNEQLRSLRNALGEVKDNVGYQSNNTKAMSGFISDLGQKLRKEMQENFKGLRANYTVNATCGCQDSGAKTSKKTKVSVATTPEVRIATTPKVRVETTTTSTTAPDAEPEVQVDDERRSEYWPDQTFGLPMSESGCPGAAAGATWSTGYVGYHTESVDENRDNVSYVNHLTGPVMRVDNKGNHFLYLHFCVKDSHVRLDSTIVNATSNQSEEATGPIQWPAGSYCINRAGGHCPLGFSSGYLDIDEEDNGHVKKTKAPLPDLLFFCCRKDGAATSPVRLPEQKPFFMYRFGGQCQAVQGMRVEAESITLDTENANNSDGYQNEFHPDGHLDDVRIELCYYSK